jgi:hypothetical protein
MRVSRAARVIWAKVMVFAAITFLAVASVALPVTAMANPAGTGAAMCGPLGHLLWTYNSRDSMIGVPEAMQHSPARAFRLDMERNFGGDFWRGIVCARHQARGCNAPTLSRGIGVQNLNAD